MSAAATRLGVVTGLVFEADIIKAAASRRGIIPPMIACAGPGADRAGRATQSLIAAGATHLLSFGIAAGLDEKMQPGDLLIASSFLRPGHPELVSDLGWFQRLMRNLPGARAGLIADSADILGSASAKTALRAATDALAADMESYGVAAAAGGRPCAAIRVVSDTAIQGLPPAAIAGANADGTVAMGRVLLSILGNVSQLPELITLGKSTGVAQKRLRALADLGLARSFFAGGLDE